MTITYHIAIDKNDDGNFTALGEAISAEVLALNWRLGMSAPYERLSAPAEAEILLRNQSQAFSPEITENIIGKFLRIQSDDGLTVRQHFIGIIHSLEPEAGELGKRRSVLKAFGRELELTQQKIRLPMLLNFRADEAISAILQQINWRYPILAGHCIIGRDSIGSSSIFPDAALVENFDAGKSVFPFFGDDWAESLPAREIIEQLLEAEGGRFFFNREGEAIFTNRHHYLQDNSLAATFSDNLSSMDYRYGADLINHLEVEIRPRSIGNPQTLLWSLAHPIRLLRGATMEITAPYTLDGFPVGALALTVPRSKTHFLANTAADGTGTNMTARVQAILFKAGASAAHLEIRNHSLQTVYFTFLELRGTPLIGGDPLRLEVQSSLSKALYGRKTLSLSLPILADTEEAESIAQWELSRRQNPEGIVREISTDTRQHPQESLALSLFDRIRIEETQTGQARDYYIIAESHHVDKGGSRHRVSWLLEPAESSQFFIIGTHSIGDSVLLVPR